MKVIKLDDGSRVMLYYRNDIVLYNTPQNPTYTKGTDLLVHDTKKHGSVFYKYHWSMRRGPESWYEMVTKEEAVSFLEEMVGDYNDFPDNDDIETLEKYDINLMQETA